MSNIANDIIEIAKSYESQIGQLQQQKEELQNQINALQKELQDARVRLAKDRNTATAASDHTSTKGNNS